MIGNLGGREQPARLLPMEMGRVDRDVFLVNPAVKGDLVVHVKESDLPSVGAASQDVAEVFG